MVCDVHVSVEGTRIKTHVWRSVETIRELWLAFYLASRKGLSCPLASTCTAVWLPTTFPGSSCFCLLPHHRNRDYRCTWPNLAFYVAYRDQKSGYQACLPSVLTHWGIFSGLELTVFGVLLLGSPYFLYFCGITSVSGISGVRLSVGSFSF